MSAKLHKIETLLLPHADAAYNLARWLTRGDQDARDVVQDAYVKAFRFIGELENEAAAKSWLLQIVRNTAFSWLKKNRAQHPYFVEEEAGLKIPDTDPDPEERVLLEGESSRVRDALEKIPPEYREVLILRELEELSYQEIAKIVGVPIGTVMSRLSRGRAKLREVLA